MAYTKEQRNLAMFGVADIEAMYEDMKDSITFSVGGVKMLVPSLLSDAQEELARNNNERARQILNVAKYVMAKS